ncbi:GntR family transcriptional regulator [Mesobaculum littorinae]|uniref:GntR family transcriptional regulator n=1 Tax=Mesobaculum littorinae TaxID=2486419 RepID=A0A438AGP9_9RHOB|nr:GntR family transcriptional regulator [Mesobaculum littorinae]RVV97886.1 GntR family transcriptional regulator [Mesobaculum littorinae]
MEEPRGHTQAMRAQFALRQRILSGALKGGQRLVEMTLAEEIRISRTPIREAMSRLVEEGLLERARSGFRVRKFTMPMVRDAIELRGLLEGAAARHAAERGLDPEEMAQLTDLIARMDTVLDGGLHDGAEDQEVRIETFAALNSEFHGLLADLSRSDIFRGEIARTTVIPFASPSAFVPNHLTRERFFISLMHAQTQHHAIVEAIGARQGGRAETLVREHAQDPRRNIEFLLAHRDEMQVSFPGAALVQD